MSDMSKKKDFWVITSIEKIVSKVCFDEPVTKEEAIWQYESSDDNIIDILDTEAVDVLEVKSAG